MQRRLAVLAWANALVLCAGVVTLITRGVTAPGGGSSASEPRHGVQIVSVDGGEYASAQFRVDAGAVVVFDNRDEEVHTFTAEGGLFDSGLVEPQGEYRWSSGGPREVRFHCEIHPRMEAVLIVEEA